jgi:hypothetical protein
MRRVRRTTWPIKYGTHACGVTSTGQEASLVKHPLQAAYRWLVVRGFTLCLRDWILTALAYSRGFKTTPLNWRAGFIGSIKKNKNRKMWGAD